MKDNDTLPIGGTISADATTNGKPLWQGNLTNIRIPQNRIQAFSIDEKVDLLFYLPSQTFEQHTTLNFHPENDKVYFAISDGENNEGTLASGTLTIREYLPYRKLEGDYELSFVRNNQTQNVNGKLNLIKVE
ncbi:MAG: hypothetical protein ACN6OX_12175 [Pseudomonas sp.]